MQSKINNAFKDITPSNNEIRFDHDSYEKEKKSVKKHLVVQIQKLDEQIERGKNDTTKALEIYTNDNQKQVSQQLLPTSQKNYSCQYCEKSFKQLCNCKRHEMTHTGERPFSCDSCEKTVTDSRNLSRHIRTHTVSV